MITGKMARIVLLLLIVASYALHGQQTITGSVIDAETGNPLPGTHIYLLNNWRQGAITDGDGVFTLTVESDMTEDSLVVSYVGFKEIIISPDDAETIKLIPIKTVGKAVIVTAKSLISEEFQYVKIKKMDIYTNPAAKADPILAVNSLPSATTTDESANISLRGSSPIETGIFLNNVPIYDAVKFGQLNGIGTFSIFNTTITENVTVFPGNPPLEFGNVASGMIAMDTDKRQIKANTNSLILSLANIGFSREQKINETQSLKLFTNWQPSYAIKTINANALQRIKKFNLNDLGLYWYGAKEKINWKVFNYSNLEGSQYSFQHPTFSGIFDQQKLRTFLTSSIKIPVAKGEIAINNGYSISNGNFQYSNVAFEVDKQDVFAGGNYHVDHQHFSVKTGWSYDHRKSRVIGNFHDLAYALGPQHPTSQINETVSVHTLESYAYLKYNVNDQWAIGTGLRKNIPTDSLDYLSSQLNISYHKEKWSLTFGGGRYHKAGLFENTGSRFFSKSNQLSLDIKYDLNSSLISSSFFIKKSEINAQKYIARGVELFANTRVAEKFALSGSFTFLDADNIDDEGAFIYDLSYFVRGNFSYMPARFWTIESTFLARQGSLFLPVSSSELDSDLEVYRPLYEEDAFRLSPYITIGLAISKIFPVSEHYHLIAFANANNLLNRNNVRNYDYSHDYSTRQEALFSKRILYFGAIINF